ncbi:Neurogenic locus protein delta [Nymphon striatum]|nr:Neurogenic locus protein delta [Nymphon striatum]
MAPPTTTKSVSSVTKMVDTKMTVADETDLVVVGGDALYLKEFLSFDLLTGENVLHVSADGLFELKIKEFNNSFGTDINGLCCQDDKESDGNCLSKCRTFFRVCATHTSLSGVQDEVDIHENNNNTSQSDLEKVPASNDQKNARFNIDFPCTIGMTVTDVEAGNVFLMNSKPLQFYYRFPFPWPVIPEILPSTPEGPASLNNSTSSEDGATTGTARTYKLQETFQSLSKLGTKLMGMVDPSRVVSVFLAFVINNCTGEKGKLLVRFATNEHLTPDSYYKSEWITDTLTVTNKSVTFDVRAVTQNTGIVEDPVSADVGLVGRVKNATNAFYYQDVSMELATVHLNAIVKQVGMGYFAIILLVKMAATLPEDTATPRKSANLCVKKIVAVCMDIVKVLENVGVVLAGMAKIATRVFPILVVITDFAINLGSVSVNMVGEDLSAMKVSNKNGI